MDESSSATTSESPTENNVLSSDKNEEVPMEIVKDDEHTPARLVINGFDDENEELVVRTIEDVQNYILSKVSLYIRDPKVNPLLLLKDRISVLQSKIKTKSEEFMKLNKMFDALYRDQVKFLRHIGVMPKVEAQTVGVSVDLPWLPDSMPGLLARDDLFKQKAAENGSKQSGNNAVNYLTLKPVKKDEPIECIDLTDDDAPSTSGSTGSNNTPAPTPSAATTDALKNRNVTITPVPTPVQNTPSAKPNPLSHPAPLPSVVATPGTEVISKPDLSISVDNNGIVLQWDLPLEAKYKRLSGYEIVGYQEKSKVIPTPSLWKKIGCVSPMVLPMSCTLTQFVEGYKYHFSIRALNKDGKPGHYSDPASIMFVPDTKKS